MACRKKVAAVDAAYHTATSSSKCERPGRGSWSFGGAPRATSSPPTEYRKSCSVCASALAAALMLPTGEYIMMKRTGEGDGWVRRAEGSGWGSRKEEGETGQRFEHYVSG